MDDLVNRLKDACVGHPHARVPWPHRLLHEAKKEIEQLRETVRLDIQDAGGMATHEGSDLTDEERRAIEYKGPKMGDFTPHERPKWCPHQDCEFVLNTQGLACVGRLPEPADHGDVKAANDGRFCMRDQDAGEITDWQVNRGDLWSLGRLFKALYPSSGFEHSIHKEKT